MKKTVVCIFILIIGCDQKKDNNPNEYFQPQQQIEILKQSVRYSAKLAPQANQETKFNPKFDWYYDLALKETDFRQCAFNQNDSMYYFLMTRKARSIWPAREAIGGKLKIDKQNKLIAYIEIFRTWKMTEDSLNTRAFELFDLMVKKKDLYPYRSKFKGDRYIEFPDDRTEFDTVNNIWRTKMTAVDSLNRMN